MSYDERAVLLELLHTWDDPARLPTSHPWWERAAAQALRDGRYWLIPTRDRSGPYLLRMWLSPPLKSKRDSQDRWDSASSLMLHYFFRGDDDAALHDHPWDFSTCILVGGYEEHLPPEGWSLGREDGPEWDVHRVWRHAGDIVSHKAEELHCVGQIIAGTFTLVQTREARRRWCFHPPGRPLIDADTYLHRTPVLA